jgi:nicotinamide-nucleotide amidase
MKGKASPGVFVLSVGDEILDGRIQNTNAAWFGEQLRLAGIPVSEARTVPDATRSISSALREASRYPLVLVTGGLGPTSDDRTLEGAEAALGSKGRRALANPVGTAPGVRQRARGAEYFFLPGPPGECRPMFERFVLPFAKKALRSRRLTHRSFWRTFGKGERDIFQLAGAAAVGLERAFPDSVYFGIHISFPYIDLTLEIHAAPKGKRPPAREVELACERIDEALGPLCFTRERESLAEALARLLLERRLTVATAESCTGGLLGKLLTDTPGSSGYYIGGAVSYANSAKEILLGVNKKTLKEEGAVSEGSVRAMAEGIRSRLGADFALAISGIAGPGGGSETKPVGTMYVAISSALRTRIVRQVILRGRGSREQNRVVATHLALNALRTELLGSHDPGIAVN